MYDRKKLKALMYDRSLENGWYPGGG
uniref:Uncharacterized protein n=1 Tax=Rhizophora mucronata TaxID=61149 RepID=A0A2P2Q1Y1_RHIMU